VDSPQRIRELPGHLTQRNAGFTRMRVFSQRAFGAIKLFWGTPMDLRILVVEDSETTRRIIRAILETREWRICGEAKNGQQAIRQFQKLRPDVVILDLTMPDLSGIEVAARLSKIDPLVPLILFTISEVEQLYDAASGAGIYAVVSKARAWDLIGTIESAITHLSDLGQPIQ
jgi:CheY-like chemotaxis protein